MTFLNQFIKFKLFFTGVLIFNQVKSGLNFSSDNKTRFLVLKVVKDSTNKGRPEVLRCNKLREQVKIFTKKQQKVMDGEKYRS